MLQVGRLWVRFLIRSFDFPIDLSFQPHYGPVVDSASNRNEYQESSWEVKGGPCMGLTTSPPSVSRCLEKVGASTPHNPIGLNGLLQG
jgi:hypothetical protein